MQRKPINQDLIKEVSQELDLPAKTVKDIIVNGQSKFTVAVLSNNLFEAVRWPFLGAFKAKHKVAVVLNYMKGLSPEQRKFFQDQAKLRKLKRKNDKQKNQINTSKRENNN